MRSYVLSMKDPKQVDLSASLVAVPIDAEKVEAELRRIALPYVRWEPAAEAAAGDLAICRMHSELPRFERPKLKLMLGSGMFRREIEEAAVGMKPGGEKTVTLPEGAVQLTLMEVSRQTIPEPDDEMVRALRLESVASVEDYREHLREKLRLDAAKELSREPLEQLICAVLDGSEFVLYPEDWRRIVNQRLDRSRVLFRQEGIDMERATPEDFVGRIPVKSYHELVAMEQDDAWRTLCLCLLGMHWAEGDGFRPTEAEYEEELRSYRKTWRATEEEAVAVTPWESFVVGAYIRHAVDLLEQVVLEQLLKEA